MMRTGFNSISAGHPRKRPVRLLAARWLLLVAMATTGLLSATAMAQKTITLDEFVIEGNIQKPEAFFILPRTNLNFEDLERREDLKQRIIDSVEAAPF